MKRTRINITTRWHKILAVGCSHGNLISPQARDGVLAFRDKFKPDFTVHLGDFLDLSCLRSGAGSGPDSAVSPEPDLKAGVAFLKELRPNLILCGNHEDRLWRMRGSPNATVAGLAQRVIDDLEKAAKQLRAELVPYDYKAWRQVADCRFMHGTLFNEQACRDTAEAFAPAGGAAVFAHSHRVGAARGRRADNPLALNTGTLCDIKQMDYAKARRATLSWSAGFVWGVHNDHRSVLWLHDNGSEKEWILPTV
jgi:predicted phosphodiesterase